jgi:hypothetical protein
MCEYNCIYVLVASKVYSIIHLFSEQQQSKRIYFIRSCSFLATVIFVVSFVSTGCASIK